jgi:hypothetical protein
VIRRRDTLKHSRPAAESTKTMPDQEAPAPEILLEVTPAAIPAEEHAPMLDVHPAHHAASSWREFFIHIATIVLGLLIAVGLEQTVEFFHHRSQGREALEQLKVERAQDERSNEVNIFTTLRHQRDLKNDLAILRAIRTHSPRPNLPFIWRRFRFVYAEDSWTRLHQSGTLDHVDRYTLAVTAYRYFNQEGFASRATQSIEDLAHAASVLRSENDPPQVSFDGSNSSDQFLNALAASNFTMDETSIQHGYDSLIEHADLTLLSPDQIDEFERAIKVALADDDTELTYCYNVKRNLANNPVH